MRNMERDKYNIKKKVEVRMSEKEIGSCNFTFDIKNMDEVQSFTTSGCFQLADVAAETIKKPGIYQIKLVLVEKERKIYE